jgi:uncharacterized metal-binding protein YceD (DUF177 family)
MPYNQISCASTQYENEGIRKMSEISKTPSPQNDILVISELSQNKPRRFELRWDADHLAQYLPEMELRALSKLSIKGQIQAEGGKNWKLNATVGASAVQACVVTMDDVKTRLDVEINRRYLSNFAAHEEEFASEEDLDAESEEIPTQINLLDLALETVSLNLDDFPRKDGTELEPVLAAPKGVVPLTDDAVKPFAGLAALKDKMKE